MLESPFRITFDTNPDDCNLHCDMCEGHSQINGNARSGFSKRRMPFPTIQNVLHDLRDCPPREIIPSTMGEPLLYRDFDKIIDAYIARTRRPVRGTMRHVRDFLDCVKSRRQTVANAEMMHRSMTTVHAANICMWLKRDMKYDPVNEVFLNDPEANRLRSRAQRAPWIY